MRQALVHRSGQRPTLLRLNIYAPCSWACGHRPWPRAFGPKRNRWRLALQACACGHTFIHRSCPINARPLKFILAAGRSNSWWSCSKWYRHKVALCRAMALGHGPKLRLGLRAWAGDKLSAGSVLLGFAQRKAKCSKILFCCQNVNRPNKWPARKCCKILIIAQLNSLFDRDCGKLEL